MLQLNFPKGIGTWETNHEMFLPALLKQECNPQNFWLAFHSNLTSQQTRIQNNNPLAKQKHQLRNINEMLHVVFFKRFFQSLSVKNPVWFPRCFFGKNLSPPACEETVPEAMELPTSTVLLPTLVERRDRRREALHRHRFWGSPVMIFHHSL